MKNRQIHLVLPAILLVLLLAGCGATRRTTYADRQIHILAVNDMHAEMDRLPRFAFIVDSLRAIYPDLILLSAGDNQSGNPFNDQYDPKGWPMIDLMNRLYFDASAVGNHEFDPSPDNFAYHIDHADFPFLCANIAPSDELHTRPYTILTTRSGYRVGIVSLLELNELGIPDTHPDKVRDYTFLDPLLVAPNYLSLRDSVDLLIYLTHLGTDQDIELAKSLPEGAIDLIVGGHSHTKIDRDLVVNGILITQALCKLQYCSLTHITMGEDKKMIARDTRLIPIELGGSEQPEMRTLVDKYFDDPLMTEAIATTATGLSSKEQIGYLMTDAFRHETGAEIALTNPGGIRRDSLPAGAISRKDVFLVDPFGNAMMTVELTPAELHELFVSGYDNLDARRPIVPSGLHVTYAIGEDGSLEGITLTDPEGNALEANRKYKVAMSSYAASVYSYGDKSRVKDLKQTTAETLINYLRSHPAVADYSDEHRITLFTVD